MKKIYSICLFFLLIFFACKKDENTYNVSYKIIETSFNSGPYSVRYSLSDGTLRSEGPFTTDSWMTPDMSGYKKNTIVSLYLDSQNGSYEMSIYVNGELSSHAVAHGGIDEQLLEAQIPN